MENTFRLRCIHEETGEIRQIRIGRTVRSALQSALLISKTITSTPWLFEVECKSSIKRFDNIVELRAWFRNNVASCAMSM